MEKGDNMSNIHAFFRCPCCNELLDEYEVSMYDIFDGMKEECYNESLKAQFDDKTQTIFKDILS